MLGKLTPQPTSFHSVRLITLTYQNRVPDDLYHHGVQRDRMSSFLSALKARCEVVTLDGGKDYRRSSEEEPQEKWFTLDQQGFEDSWGQVPGKEGKSSPCCLNEGLTGNRVEISGGVWTTGGC